jgi:hypothetical protein
MYISSVRKADIEQGIDQCQEELDNAIQNFTVGDQIPVVERETNHYFLAKVRCEGCKRSPMT